ncbi:MAG: hypothetical protein Q8M92_10515, partial [Candidatus Subteraquimicrobiales bacterium]|nr:hypothetical protein [Candidatus Subteraquimicrobiales bacterium]
MDKPKEKLVDKGRCIKITELEDGTRVLRLTKEGRKEVKEANEAYYRECRARGWTAQQSWPGLTLYTIDLRDLMEDIICNSDINIYSAEELNMCCFSCEDIMVEG